MEAFPALRSATNKIRIFVSYDREHDEDLLDLLVHQAAKPRSGFVISARSAERSPTDLWDERLRRVMQAVDQVIVICGEHTDCSGRVAAELRIAQEEDLPYFLLWGRREPMCTKPMTAKPADCMYSWTPEILQNQIVTLRRLAESNEPAPQRSQATAAAKA